MVDLPEVAQSLRFTPPVPVLAMNGQGLLAAYDGLVIAVQPSVYQAEVVKSPALA